MKKPKIDPEIDPSFEGRQEAEGVCTGRKLTNPRIIEIALPDKTKVYVFVRKPDFFTKGMLVKAFREHGPGKVPLWYLNSPEPRYKGRY